MYGVRSFLLLLCVLSVNPFERPPLFVHIVHRVTFIEVAPALSNFDILNRLTKE